MTQNELSALILCFFDHFFLVSDFSQLPCQDFLKCFSIFFHCCLCIWNFWMLEASEWTCVQDCIQLWNSSLLQWCDLDEVCVQLLLALVSCFRRHQQYKRILSCLSQYCDGFLHCSLSVFCKALLLASELPTFYERLSFIVSWKSSSFGSIKNIPLIWLALSSFGSSTAYLCFAFFFAASDINFHRSGRLSLVEQILRILSVHLTILFSPSTFQ